MFSESGGLAGQGVYKRRACWALHWQGSGKAQLLRLKGCLQRSRITPSNPSPNNHGLSYTPLSLRACTPPVVEVIQKLYTTGIFRVWHAACVWLAVYNWYKYTQSCWW